MVKKVEKVKPSSVELVSALLRQTLSLLGIEAKSEVKQEEEVVEVNFATDNPGVLIGYHGETLASLQRLLSLMAYRQLGEWVRIWLDVGDYRQRRQEALERMAYSAAQKVKFSKETYSLPPMSPAERRIIHLALADHPEVTTESTGEGLDRRVAVRPKTLS